MALDSFDAAISWIEAHEHTVDLLKWIAAGIVAWALGVFRAVRAWTRRPVVSIVATYSRCFVEEYEELDVHKDVSLIVLLLDAAVLNSTPAKIGVQGFELQLRRKGFWKRWTFPVSSIGFPTIPRTPMPDGAIKVVPVWLTAFEEYSPSLALHDVEAQNSAAGMLFFAVVVPNASLIHDEHYTVKLSVKLGTGERRSVVAKLKHESDFEKLEATVPSSVRYVRNKVAWRYRD